MRRIGERPPLDTLERMEHVAQFTFHASQLGAITPLSPEQISRLQQIGDKQGWPRKKISEEACNNCNACGKFGPNGCGPKPAVAPAGDNAPDVATGIAEEVAAVLGRRAG